MITSANHWAEKIYRDAMLRQGSTTSTVKQIQAEALQWAVSRITADGNPDLTKESIMSEVHKLTHD